MHRITKRVVDALPARVKLSIAFDADVRVFGVSVMPSAVKTLFVLEYRPGAGGRAETKPRRAALDALAADLKGHDPQAEKVDSRTAITGRRHSLMHSSDTCARTTSHGPLPRTRRRVDRLRAVYGRQPAGERHHGYR